MSDKADGECTLKKVAAWLGWLILTRVAVLVMELLRSWARTWWEGYMRPVRLGKGRDKLGRFVRVWTMDVNPVGVKVQALIGGNSMHYFHGCRAYWELAPDRKKEMVTFMGSWLKKAAEEIAQPENAVHFRDEKFEKDYPALFDFLASKVGPNGKEREGACLLVYARDNEVTCCLKDRGLKRAFYGRSDGVWEALRELEAKIKADA